MISKKLLIVQTLWKIRAKLFATVATCCKPCNHMAQNVKQRYNFGTKICTRPPFVFIKIPVFENFLYEIEIAWFKAHFWSIIDHCANATADFFFALWQTSMFVNIGKTDIFTLLLQCLQEDFKIMTPEEESSKKNDFYNFWIPTRTQLPSPIDWAQDTSEFAECRNCW